MAAIWLVSDNHFMHERIYSFTGWFLALAVRALHPDDTLRIEALGFLRAFRLLQLWEYQRDVQAAKRRDLAAEWERKLAEARRQGL